jgi:uncharacterized membrane protein
MGGGQMNKKGSILIYGMMLGLVVLILALALAPSVTEFATTSRTSLDCSNESISNFDRATCYVTDLSPFYFIGGLIFIGGAIVTSKILFGGSNE